MIEVKSLKVLSTSNVFRLNIPMLKIEPFGITALVGHNGAGKSSLLKLIAGIEEPFMGSVLYNGKNTFCNYEELKHKIHLLSWNISFYHSLTAQDHLSLIKNIAPQWNKLLEEELISSFSLPLQKYLSQFSRGELAKLRLLLSLPRMPSIVLLDEVTNELDTDSRRTIFKKLDSYSFESRSLVIVATNMIEDIERYATNVILLKKGEVILSGNLDTIKEERQSSFEEIVRSYERIAV